MKNRLAGQLSVEIFILVGMALFLLVPVLFYSYNKANISNEDIAIQKAEFATNRLAALADSIGYLGEGAKIREILEIPPYFKSISTNNKDIIIEIDSVSGKKQIVSTTSFYLELHGAEKVTAPGNYVIEISALPHSQGGKVRLTVE